MLDANKKKRETEKVQFEIFLAQLSSWSEVLDMSIFGLKHVELQTYLYYNLIVSCKGTN